MELFYCEDIAGGIARLDAEESGHCVRVLRHRAGDVVNIIDGRGTMYECRLFDDSPKGAQARVEAEFPGWGAHPYHLTVACSPTKNNDRYEWMVEKVTEIGVDAIVPVIGERSERKVYKSDRARRIALSAAKQSLKALLPAVTDPLPLRDFLLGGPAPDGLSASDAAPSRNPGLFGDGAPLKLIAYCFEDESVPRISIRQALSGYDGRDVIVLIGPEGDFSPAEAKLAIERGFVPVHLGTSRLRTETAAITAATAVYLRYITA